MRCLPKPALRLCTLALAVVVTGLSLSVGQRLEASDAKRVFKAGAFAADITPPRFPISLNGGMTDRQATDAADPLHARCLVLDDGATRIAIVVCDSCMVPRDLMDAAKDRAAKATGIPTERILISATHTHSAPTLSGVFQSEPDEDYRQFLVEKIAEGITRANGNLRAARVGWGTGSDPSQVFNRRWYMKQGAVNADPFGGAEDRVRMNPGIGNQANLKPSGPVDPEIGILSIQTPDGKPVALLANYSLHYVGGVPGNLASADYFGEFARRLTTALGANEQDPQFVGILSNGTSGNINNVNYSLTSAERREPFEQIKVVAASVVDATMRAYRKIEHKDWAPIAMRETEIELGVRLPSEADVEQAKKLLSEAGPGPYRDRTHIYARETLLLAHYPPQVKAKIQAIRIGELGIATSPCETFVETGLAIKEASPLKPTFIIELANGYNGYLPTPEHHELGGYETWRARSSYLAADAEPKVRETILELLHEVAKEDAAGADARGAGDVEVVIGSWDDVQKRVRAHRGKVVAIDIWTTSCPACLEKFPQFVSLVKEYGRDRVSLIAVNTDYDGVKTKPPEYYLPRVKEFLAQRGGTNVENVMLNVPLLEFLDAVDLSSSPAVYVYDADGKLVRRFDNDNARRAADEFTMEQVEAQIADLINGVQKR
ncbi:MAG: neutral/alkaline non-lysosomal ceramidase N-terminal domain-containing protein [Planctomycetes bacterium]|nr:neutral/alkaline non-lysosomal ceramidase N-terminal domain-containing protein [Planctomycetota bacterium]